MRLVATDLDGTIVGRDGAVSPRTIAALRACEQQRVPVVIVTGRPPRWLHDVLDATDLHGLAVAANGAVLYDCATRVVNRAWTIPPEIVLETVERLRVELPDLTAAIETPTGYLREPGYVSSWVDADEPPRAPLAELLQSAPDGVIKILVRGPGTGDELLAVARRLVPDLVEATHSNSLDNLLELGPAGVSKAVTLEWLAATHGVDRHGVVAFGDQPNDIPMLRWAGVGYAMANGHPDALAAADEIAPPCAEDGVAQVLEARLG